MTDPIIKPRIHPVYAALMIIMLMIIPLYAAQQDAKSPSSSNHEEGELSDIGYWSGEEGAAILKKIENIEIAVRNLRFGLLQKFDEENAADSVKKKSFEDALDKCNDTLFYLYSDAENALKKYWDVDVAWNVVYGYSNFVKIKNDKWALLIIGIIFLDGTMKFAEFIKDDFEDDDFQVVKDLVDKTLRNDKRIDHLRDVWEK